MVAIVRASVVLAFVLSACAIQGPPRDSAEVARSPVAPFYDVQPFMAGAMPAAARRTPDELLAWLKVRYPQLGRRDIDYKMAGDWWIRAGGAPYRLMWIEVFDNATSNMHGTCSQHFIVYVSQSGEFTHSYVQEYDCPI